MQSILSLLSSFYEALHNFIWGTPMLLLFFLTGIYFTVRTGFYQVTHIKEWLSKTILTCFKKSDSTKSKDSKSISQWQALTTALASTSGTGNIAGVATALTAGGPGAIFWMWISAFFGMMTHYAEVVLGMHYRYKDEEGNWIGGPMIYMERGLKSPFLAAAFSLFCILATLGMGTMSQSNSVAEALNHSFGMSRFVVGLIVAAMVGLVIMGGVKRIASVSEKIVPFMSILYMLGTIIVIAVNYQALPQVFQSIFSEAFNFRAAGSGVLGYGISIAVKKGVSRGVFSNEAGLGSSVLVHTASDNNEPVVQGMWGIFEVFTDTVVVCTLTAVAILVTGVYNQETYLKALALDQASGQSSFFDALPNGVTLTATAFAETFGGFGDIFVSVSIVLFALATLIGWSYYGEKACHYLLGARSIPYYKVIYVGFIVIGAVANLEFVWSLSDTFNALMALPNLIAITLLSGQVFAITKDYYRRNPHSPS